MVESTRGFLNQEKPLYFLENKERYAKFLDKIVHVIVDEFPEFGPVGESDYWEVENFQRNQIMRGLKICKPNSRDIVIISDVDEILRNEKIPQLVKMIDKRQNDVVFAEFEFYKFFINRKLPFIWNVSLATSWENLSKYILTPQSFRNLSGFVKGHAFNGFEVLEAAKKHYPKKKWAFARIRDAGWHFTSMGSFEMFLQKIASYSHVNVNNEYNRKIENIKNEISQLQWCEITDQFPKYVAENKERLEACALIDQKNTIYH